MRSGRRPGPPVWWLAALAVAAAAVAVRATGAAAAQFAEAQHFLTFYAGVFALVAATTAVAFGLVASDRFVASISHRLAAQALHRLFSVLTIVFLITHIVLEIAAGRSAPADSVVPFLARGRTLDIGLGTVASDLLILIAVTGYLRGRFARGGPPWLWRAVHAIAYLAWPLSIAHGLLAGREAKDWVVWSYLISLLMVGLALLARLVLVRHARTAELRRTGGRVVAPVRAETRAWR